MDSIDECWRNKRIIDMSKAEIAIIKHEQYIANREHILKKTHEYQDKNRDLVRQKK